MRVRVGGEMIVSLCLCRRSGLFTRQAPVNNILLYHQPKIFRCFETLVSVQFLDC